MIRFGTDGWRAIIAREFNFDNVGRVAGALSKYLLESNKRINGVVISYDTRFLSDQFALHFARVVASNNIPVVLSSKFTPTPVLSFAVKQLGLNAGVMVTASHNPYFYNGIKFKASYGGPVLDDFVQQIEKRIESIVAPIDEKRVRQNIQYLDLTKAYFEHLKKVLRVEVVEKFYDLLAYDAMHGCGIGFLQHFFEEFGLKAKYLRHEENPLFSRGRPEPIPENLLDLQTLVREQAMGLGLATDGDADRCAVIDDQGLFVELHDLMPLLARYLIKERKFPGDFVRTTSLHPTIDRLASTFNRRVKEVPVGFKNVTEQMLAENILIGGEESGGFGYGFHLPERDGILTVLLVLEMLAYYQVKISELVSELRQKFGPFFYLRKDISQQNSKILIRNLKRLRENIPERVVKQQVTDFSLKDGLKLYLNNDCWILIRVSQTEPLARIYVAGRDEQTVRSVMKWGVEQITEDTNH